MIKKIAVLTSGGDAPGMNAAIRAVVLAGERANVEVIGYKYGYNGLINQNYKKLEARSVHNLIQQGGTVLHSGRCLAFKTVKSAQIAANHLDQLNIDGLVVIGGDGSFRGAEHLSQHWRGKVIGLPGTIDNDIPGTDTSIGFSTAVDTAVQSIDKVRDTADAFERLFLVEVMGRNAGYLALSAALASASNYVILPEFFDKPSYTLTHIAEQVKSRRHHVGHDSFIIVVTENVWPEGINALSQALHDCTNAEVRPVILGHVQRGGSPSSEDRILATKLGYQAVQAILNGETGIMLGTEKGIIIHRPLSYSWTGSKTYDPSDIEAMEMLLNRRFQ